VILDLLPVEAERVSRQESFAWWIIRGIFALSEWGITLTGGKMDAIDMGWLLVFS